jgi:benzoylformate decarboxylase
MFELSKQFLDHSIKRRTFVRRLAQAGMSLAGATAIANSLAAPGSGGSSGSGDQSLPPPGPGRTVTGLTGGEVMVEFLVDWDITYMFGLAGSEEIGLVDALVDRPVKYTTAIHENAVMAMADGFSRATGQTSIVQLHSVAGTAYALGQLAGSYRDRIPVVVTAGRQSTDYRGEGGFLESPNLTELPRDYTQWVWDVMNVETIPEVLRRAFLLAEAPPGGPTFVTFSKDLWEVPVESVEIIPRNRSLVNDDVPLPDGMAEQIADALLAAEHPCIFLGNECIKYEISPEVAEIAELTGSMVMLALKIPVVFPNTHPNFVGEVLEDPSLFSEIDCFWSIGAPMFQLFAKPKNPLVSRDATVIHTSLVAGEVGRNYPVDIAAVASIDATSKEVLEVLRRRSKDRPEIAARNERLREYSANRRAKLDRIATDQWDNDPIATSRLMSELNRVTAPDAEIISELITSDPYPRRYLTFDHTVPPEQRRKEYLTTSGVLGWGVAAAIGVKIGKPHKEVWCLTGDGCFNFGSQALWSAARYQVPIGVVIFNNREYQANRVNANRYGGRQQQTGKYIGVSLDHPDIDYVSMAAAYGIEGERLTDPGEVVAALERCKRSMQEGRPYVIDARIARQYEGRDSEYYDFFSVADMQNSQT